MAGNQKFEFTSSPETSFGQNGQKGSYSGSRMDRSGSFREGGESRLVSSGKATSKDSASSPVDQFLNLEPIAMDPKICRYGEFRRVLGFSAGIISEENSSGVANPKNPPVEELKRVRASIADFCVKASGRSKKMGEHLNKLNKYVEALTSKKQQRNELLTNGQSGSSLNMKIGVQMHRAPSELGNQKFDDRPKNGGLNKRIRTSMAESRAESRGMGLPRQQPVTMTKERDLLKDSNSDSGMVEEKIKRLPAGGEGWDRKMKRKRSVSSGFPRATDNNGELKRRLINEPSVQTFDSTHSFRPGSSNDASTGNKLDSSASPVNSGSRTMPKNEQEKPVPSRDINKERVLGKGHLKLTNREENHAVCPSPVVKGKASRAPRTGSIPTNSTTSNSHRLPGTLESWDPPPGPTKNSSVESRKRSMPSGPSSPPITQWVGQRPQKISRTRRTNLIPVASNDEVQTQSGGCSPSDFSPTLNLSGPNASPLSKNGIQNFKARPEHGLSPARLSESEESERKEKDLMEERYTNGAGPSARKNKFVAKEDTGDGFLRQDRSGRASPFSGASVSPMREKLDSPSSTKPLARSGSDKKGSKSGRPLKKLSDRKGFSRLGHLANGGSPDINGESEDDREDLLVAANYGCNSSVLACSSSFWKKAEPLFASIGPDEKSYLSEELKLAEEYCRKPSEFSGHGNGVQDVHGGEEISASDILSGKRNGLAKSETGLKDSSAIGDVAQKLPNGHLDTEKRRDTVTPLYQRVLSALIMDDEVEEIEDNEFKRQSSFPNGDAHLIFSCNGNTDYISGPGVRNYPCNGQYLEGDRQYMHSEVEVLVRLSRRDYGPESVQTNCYQISSFDYQYEQMSLEEKLILELHSVGLFLETMPKLDSKESEVLNQELVQLEKELEQQMSKKVTCLDKINKGLEGGHVERWDPEQTALDKLVELAYKKILATRGSYASKHRIPKVPKQVALAFAKRTLSRCRQFENSGTSCFAEPPLRDIVYAPPPWITEDPTVADDTYPSDANPQSDHAFNKNGPISNRGKRREVLLDDVGGAMYRATSNLGILDGAKGKRSDRDKSTSSRGGLAKGGRSLVGCSKGERKNKAKPTKQKTGQLSTSGNGIGNTTQPGDGGSQKRDIRYKSTGNVPLDPAKNRDPLNDIDPIEELGVDAEIGAPQDFNNWFNFDVDGIQEHDDIVGLEIPMDDLSELNMF